MLFTVWITLQNEFNPFLECWKSEKHVELHRSSMFLSRRRNCYSLTKQFSIESFSLFRRSTNFAKAAVEYNKPCNRRHCWSSRWTFNCSYHRFSDLLLEKKIETFYSFSSIERKQSNDTNDSTINRTDRCSSALQCAVSRWILVESVFRYDQLSSLRRSEYFTDGKLILHLFSVTSKTPVLHLFIGDKQIQRLFCFLNMAEWFLNRCTETFSKDFAFSSRHRFTERKKTYCNIAMSREKKGEN